MAILVEIKYVSLFSLIESVLKTSLPNYDEHQNSLRKWDIILSDVKFSASLHDFDIPAADGSKIKVERGLHIKGKLNLFNLFFISGELKITPSKDTMKSIAADNNRNEQSIKDELFQDTDLRIFGQFTLNATRLNQEFNKLNNKIQAAIDSVKVKVNSAHNQANNDLQNVKCMVGSNDKGIPQGDLKTARTKINYFGNAVRNGHIMDMQGDNIFDCNDSINTTTPGCQPIFTMSQTNISTIGRKRRLNDWCAWGKVNHNLRTRTQIKHAKAQSKKLVNHVGNAFKDIGRGVATASEEFFNMCCDFLKTLSDIILGGKLIQVDVLHVKVDVKIMDELELEFRMKGSVLMIQLDLNIRVRVDLDPIRSLINAVRNRIYQTILGVIEELDSLKADFTDEFTAVETQYRTNS